jgi:hypothetical protein
MPARTAIEAGGQAQGGRQDRDADGQAGGDTRHGAGQAAGQRQRQEGADQAGREAARQTGAGPEEAGDGHSEKDHAGGGSHVLDLRARRLRPNIAYSVVVWLHPFGKDKQTDIEDFISSWSNFCDDNNVILICPQSGNPRGWTPGEADFIVEAIRSVASTYTVDMRRIVAHGMAQGGDMAFYMGFHARSLIHGVATVAAHMSSNPREKLANQPLAFFLVVGGKDPQRVAVAETKDKLLKFKYPVIHREIPNIGIEYIDGKAGTPTLEELVRWIDALDRI